MQSFTQQIINLIIALGLLAIVMALFYKSLTPFPHTQRWVGRMFVKIRKWFINWTSWLLISLPIDIIFGLVEALFKSIHKSFKKRKSGPAAPRGGRHP